MPNTPTTPASVAARLTDEEIETNARGVLNMAWFSNYEKAGCSPEKIAAVLRDYVRLRTLANAVREVIDGKDEVDAQVKDGFVVTAVGAVAQIKRRLAEAEKGEAE